MVELPPNCQIVLVDWDNTFRKGFTVTAWVEFLAERGLFKELDTIRATVGEFQRGALKYESFCRRMALAYAVGLAGQLESDVFAAGISFVAADSAQLFRFVAPLCAYFAERHLKVIVVSGAPEELLQHYAKAVGFELGGALRLEVKGGRYTGGVAQNCGLSDEKAAAVSRLSRTNEVVVAMGDSTSDLPLLKAAAVGFIVLGTAHDSVPTDPSFIRFDARSDPQIVIELVKRHVATLRGA